MSEQPERVDLETPDLAAEKRAAFEAYAKTVTALAGSEAAALLEIQARALGLSLIPTSTGSARAITKIFPELTGKLNGHAVRVPLLNASLTDFVFEAKRPVAVEEVNGYFKAAAEGELKGILGYEERPLVSVDYLNDPRSSIVDALSTMVVNGTQVKIYAWYDNEWGYANRMMDIVGKVAGML